MRRAFDARILAIDAGTAGVTAVVVTSIVETSAPGATFPAGLGTGGWGSTDELRDTWQLDRSFAPRGKCAR